MKVLKIERDCKREMKSKIFYDLLILEFMALQRKAQAAKIVYQILNRLLYCNVDGHGDMVKVLKSCRRKREYIALIRCKFICH